MTHLAYAAATADAQVGRIMDKLEADGELDNTLVVLTADHGSVARPGTSTARRARRRLRVQQLVLRRRRERRRTSPPQAALQPLVATGNVGFSYSDS